MIKITIEGDDAQQVRADVLTLAGMMGGDTGDALVIDRTSPKAEEPKPLKKKVGGKFVSEPSATPAAETPAASPAADETDRELLEPVPPAPAASAQVVDAGTGQPVAPAEPVKQMTVEEVQKAAAQLVQKDIEQLKALLKKYDAANVKAVKPAQLGDFAADVLAALG